METIIGFMDEELRKLQEAFFADLVSRLDLKPTVSPIDPTDFPGIDWSFAEAGEEKVVVAEKDTQLGFYDMQLPCSTTKSRPDRKLSLILDLDQTLVHAVKMNDLFGEILCPTVPGGAFEKFVIDELATSRNPQFIQAFTSRIDFSPENAGLVAPVPPQCVELPESNQLLATWLENDMYLIKLRPGLRKFIRDLAELYELHIYTKANRNYLNFLINELDPLGKYFTSAVARDDSPDLDIELKVLNRVCCRSLNEIVVFDDRVDIWTESTGNVVRAQPYNFLHLRRMSVIKALAEIVSASPDPNGASTAVALDFDCHLHFMKEVLLRIHAEFESHKLGVPDIVNGLRRRVLPELNMLFTGFTEVAQFVKEVEEFGAHVALDNSETSDDACVLIAAKHTKRVYNAKKTPNTKVVHGSWLDHCRATWTLPSLNVFDHSRFRVNPDGTFIAVDSWEVAWVAANQNGSMTLGNADGSDQGFAHSVASMEPKKRRRA